MSLPGQLVAAGGRPPPRRLRLRVAARPSSRLLELGIRPRQILTKEAFENAIAVDMALGGSTNAVLHLLAIAHEARVELELEDFNRVAARVPHIADTKPHGKYHMVDLDRVGGVPVVMKRPARRRAAPRRLPHRHRQDDGREPRRRSTRRRPTAPSSTRSTDPIHAVGGIAVLTRLAGPQGLGGEGGRHRLRLVRGPGPRVRRRGRRRWRRSSPAAIEPGDVVVIRYEGPKGGPGHARDAGGHRRDEGRRAAAATPRSSPTAGSPAAPTGFCIGHVAPEAVDGGPDRVRARRRPHRHRRRRPLDRPRRRRRPSSSARKADWKLPEPRYTTGVLAKYARLAQGAERGAITEACSRHCDAAQSCRAEQLASATIALAIARSVGLMPEAMASTARSSGFSRTWSTRPYAMAASPRTM